MEFRILGPLEVVAEGEPVALGTLKERLVLGVLLLHANEFVSRERLIDDLWGEKPPPTARKAVNVYVSKLRKALGVSGADPITTAAGGYRLQIDLGQLDAGRMQDLVASARECLAKGELDGAAALFSEALLLWRGPTLAGLQLESRGRDEVARLDELRLAVLMDRIDCDLALGRNEQALGELGVLVHEHPLRERLRAQQMLALYRADRQADALDAYVEARQTLVDDLGIEPSEALQRLQQAILRHDPSLEAPEGTASVNGLIARKPAPPPPIADAETGEERPRTPYRPRRWQLALAGVVVLAAAAAGAAILSDSAGAKRILPNSLVQLDPRTVKPILVRQVGVEPNAITITPTAIWTVDEGAVSRYDLKTGRVDTSGITPDAQPSDIAFDRTGSAWITSASESQYAPRVNAFVTRVTRGPGVTGPGLLDPGQPTVSTMTLPPLRMAGFEAVGSDRLWVISGPHGPVQKDDRLAVVDPRTLQATALKLDERATAIASGYQTIWVGTYGGPNFGGNRPDDSRLEAIRDGQLEAIRTGRSKPPETVLEKHGAGWGPTSIAVGDGAVWVITSSSHQLFKIDPITLQIEHQLDLSAEDPTSVAVGAGAVWISGAHSVTKIDPHTDKIIHTQPIPVGFTCAVAATSTTLWLAVDGRPC